MNTRRREHRPAPTGFALSGPMPTVVEPVARDSSYVFDEKFVQVADGFRAGSVKLVELAAWAVLDANPEAGRDVMALFHDEDRSEREILQRLVELDHASRTVRLELEDILRRARLTA